MFVKIKINTESVLQMFTSLRRFVKELYVYSSSIKRKIISNDDAGAAQMILASKVDDGRRGSRDVCQTSGDLSES